MKVGARELKNRLGHYLAVVKAGETVYVTDRGRIVAEMKPRSLGRSTEAEALAGLVADGTVTLGSGRHEDCVPVRQARRGKRASQMIIEDRG